MASDNKRDMLNRPQHLLALAAVLSAIFASAPAFGQEFSEADLEFFERNVRPILANICSECHGPEEQESNLRLDSRASVLIGGDNGPVAVPGKPGRISVSVPPPP